MRPSDGPKNNTGSLRVCIDYDGFFFFFCVSCQVIINSTITPNMTFTKTSQKFGQWADSRANTVFGLGFTSEQQLTKVRAKISVASHKVTGASV